jgi:thiamine pyrophosphate-dependent acetolactate synthase large subunit-like protein
VDRQPTLNRRVAVEVLARLRTDQPVVTGPGLSGRWLLHAGHRPPALYQMELPYATPLCLGLALALPGTRVIALEGDGALVSGLAGLTTIGRYQPPNLVVLALDNGAYATTGTGEFATATAHGTDLAAVARACGIASACTVWTEDELEAALREALASDGPHVVVARVTTDDRAETGAFAPDPHHLTETAVEFRLAVRRLRAR